MRINILLILLFGLLAGGCSDKNIKLFEKNRQVIKEMSDLEYKKEEKYEYKIAVGDRVKISVYNQSSNANNNLSMLVSKGSKQDVFPREDRFDGTLVSKDGKIRLPLIGLVKIIGMTEIEAEGEIIKRYKKYLRNPYVTVKILDQRLFVLGEVKSPGVVRLPHGAMTLFEALATSQGFSKDAERTDVLIIRGDLRDPKISEVDLTDVSSIKVANLILHPNDIVYVQPQDGKVAFENKLSLLKFVHAALLPFVDFVVIKNVLN